MRLREGGRVVAMWGSVRAWGTGIVGGVFSTRGRSASPRSPVLRSRRRSALLRAASVLASPMLRSCSGPRPGAALSMSPRTASMRRNRSRRWASLSGACRSRSPLKR
ncbi:hypothetical protein [Nitrosomonas sp. Nm58]|uniref:hypothetical protein n=1 Tax=Nitrosomonas sp. Nm58 TaxID=200126 RepID=UPI00115FA3A1|nr:hypothetical protein [Nitrosomonas sp. Nm58]